MFFQFFILGSWLPLVFGYLGTGGLDLTGAQQTAVLIAFPVSAMLAMFFGNQFADRNFAAEKFLAFSHLISGAALLGMCAATDFQSFAILMWVHGLFYMPTISITNSIALAAMIDPSREYGIVRMGGTIGWIAASWPLLFFLSDDPMAARYTFLLAGAASLIFACYSLVLPHTPAKKNVNGFAWVSALRSLATPFIAVLWIVTMMDSAIHDLSFMWTGNFLISIGIEQKWVMPIMSLGQVAEIAAMASLGFFLSRLGWKTTMIIGVVGQVIRFSIFAYLPYPAAVITGIFLHGICYAFYFATISIFVDEFLPKDARSSTQGLFNLMLYGGGPMISRAVAPILFGRYSTKTEDVTVVDYQQLFQFPLLVAVVSLVILAVAFWPPKKVGGV